MMISHPGDQGFIPPRLKLVEPVKASGQNSYRKSHFTGCHVRAPWQKECTTFKLQRLIFCRESFSKSSYPFKRGRWRLEKATVALSLCFRCIARTSIRSYVKIKDIKDRLNIQNDIMHKEKKRRLQFWSCVQNGWKRQEMQRTAKEKMVWHYLDKSARREDWIWQEVQRRTRDRTQWRDLLQSVHQHRQGTERRNVESVNSFLLLLKWTK